MRHKGSLWVDDEGEASAFAMLCLIFAFPLLLIAIVTGFPKEKERMFNKCIEAKVDAALCVDAFHKENRQVRDEH